MLPKYICNYFLPAAEASFTVDKIGSFGTRESTPQTTALCNVERGTSVYFGCENAISVVDSYKGRGNGRSYDFDRKIVVSDSFVARKHLRFLLPAPGNPSIDCCSKLLTTHNTIKILHLLIFISLDS